MTTIDTIKFSMKFSENHINSIKAHTRGGLNLNNYEVYFINSYYRNLFKVRTQGSKIYFLVIFINENPALSLFANNVHITVHMNNFLSQVFKDSYVQEQEYFDSLFDIIKNLLQVSEFNDHQLALTEIHVCKDVYLKYPVNYYLEVLKYNSFSGKYSIQTTGNKTITIHGLKDLKKKGESLKPERVAIVYDKSRKLRFREEDIGDYNILRFEYIFKNHIRRNLGIVRNSFSLSDLYRMEWADLFTQHFSNKYFKDMSCEKLENRQTASSEKKYSEKDLMEWYYTLRVLTQKKKAKDKKRRSLNRHYWVNFKKYLRKEYGEEKIKGIDLYQELYEKVYEPEDEINGEIPNPYYMNLRTTI